MRVIIFVLFIMSCVTACDRAAPLTWKEELQLHDGRKLIAERADLMGGRAEPGQTGAPRERTVSFADPDSPQKKYTHRITGSSSYLLLDFDNGTPWLIVLVGPFSTDTDCPIGSYETFRWQGESWESVAYALLPAKFTKPNMTVSYTRIDRAKDKFVTAEKIAQQIELTRKNGATGAAWRLVQLNDHGRSIDCQAYPKVMKEEKK